MKTKKLIWQSKNHGYFWHDLYIYQVYKNRMIENILGFQEENILVTYSNDNYSFYLDDDEILRNGHKINKFYMSNLYEKFVDDIFKLIDYPICFNNEIDDYKKWKNRIKNLCSKYCLAVSYYMCTESYYTELVFNNLAKKYNDETILDFVKPVLMPTVIREQIEWYLLCLDIVQEVTFDLNKIKKHLEKWENIVCSHQTQPYSLDNLIERYKVDIKNEEMLKKNLSILQDNFNSKKLLEKQQRMKKQIESDDLQIVKRLSEIAYLRLELRHVWMKLGYNIDQMILRRYKNINGRIYEFSIEEILGENIDLNQERKEFIYVRMEGKDKLYYNGTQNMFYSKNSLVFSNDNIVGSSSYGVPVVGKALIIDSIKGIIQDIDSDSILVVPQIIPQLIPVIGRCKGIVTNEGGITGHANIIAREMEKTAIMGTIIGTSVLKNGSILFLDTKSNMVKVLNNE